MHAITPYFREKLFRHVFDPFDEDGIIPFYPPSMYLALWRSEEIGGDLPNGNECGITRLPLDPGGFTFADGVVSNDDDLVFTQDPGDPREVEWADWLHVYDAPSDGNLLFMARLVQPAYIGEATPTIQAGRLKFDFRYPGTTTYLAQKVYEAIFTETEDTPLDVMFLGGLNLVFFDGSPVDGGTMTPNDGVTYSRKISEGTPGAEIRWVYDEETDCYAYRYAIAMDGLEIGGHATHIAVYDDLIVDDPDVANLLFYAPLHEPIDITEGMPMMPANSIRIRL